MKLQIDCNAAEKAGEEMLDLSRKLRRARLTLEDSGRQLQHFTELDECKKELRDRTEDLSLLTAKLLKLSVGLREIMDCYSRAEAGNDDRLEETRSGLYPGRAVEGTLEVSSDRTRAILNQILYR